MGTFEQVTRYGDNDTPVETMNIETFESQDQTHGHDRRSPVLTTLPLAALIFYEVSGGPFGIEPAVRAGGGMYALLGFLILPLVWSVPESLITAELGSAYPEASGGVAWVEEAFGTTTGWIAGYLTWLSGATDNAIYPVLFLEYLIQTMMHEKNIDGEDTTMQLNPVARFLVLSSTCIVLAYINWLGLKLVGNISMVVCAVSMSPFVILCVWGAHKVDPKRWFQTPTMGGFDDDVNHDTDDTVSFLNPSWGGIMWRPFMNNLFWNLNSFDSAACFAGEVQDPGQTFPRAMWLGVSMVSCCYFFPLLIAIGASDDTVSQAKWVDGYLATVASDVVSPWLGTWTVLASGISNLALFQAEMSSDAFQIMGMADRGLLPQIFRARSQHGTPTYGILLGTSVLLVMSIADFSDLVEMLNFNYSIALLLEFAAFVKLRVSKSHVSRPYRVPLSTVGCIVMLIPTTSLTLFVMLMASAKTYVYASLGMLAGFFFYLTHRRNTAQYFVLPSSDELN